MWSRLRDDLYHGVLWNELIGHFDDAVSTIPLGQEVTRADCLGGSQVEFARKYGEPGPDSLLGVSVLAIVPGQSGIQPRMVGRTGRCSRSGQRVLLMRS